MRLPSHSSDSHWPLRLPVEQTRRAVRNHVSFAPLQRYKKIAFGRHENSPNLEVVIIFFQSLRPKILLRDSRGRSSTVCVQSVIHRAPGRVQREFINAIQSLYFIIISNGVLYIFFCFCPRPRRLNKRRGHKKT